MDSPVIALVAGETSGDQLGSALMRELRQRYPQAQFVGIGGAAMKSQGLEVWWDCQELAVMGLAEVIGHLPRLLRLRKELLGRLLKLKPDVLIGIDAPDFNLGLEKQARAAGITTVQYVSPAVWAWRQGRVKGIAQSVDLVMCLFPFEPEFYRSHDVSAQYTGHPMADEIPDHNDKGQARIELGLDADTQCIALLPGSRNAEVGRLSTHMVTAAGKLAKRYPGLQFIAPMANTGARSHFESALRAQTGIKCTLLDGQARIAMAAADLVICASGTASLETMLVNRPMVVVYQVNALTYAAWRHFGMMKIRFFSLPNILAGEALVPELGQHQVTAGAISEASIAWLDDPARCEKVQQRFADIHGILRKNAASSAADCIHSLLSAKK